MQKIWVILAAIALLAAGCGGQSPNEVLISGEDVIRTAEAIAAATLNAATLTPSPAPATPTDTPEPVTDTPEPTATPDVPIAVSNYNANVRSGPGESYGVVDFFLAGQEAQITGQYLDEQSMTWFFLDRLDEGIDGWIFFGAATVYGDLNTVPFLVVEADGD